MDYVVAQVHRTSSHTQQSARTVFRGAPTIIQNVVTRALQPKNAYLCGRHPFGIVIVANESNEEHPLRPYSPIDSRVEGNFAETRSSQLSKAHPSIEVQPDPNITFINEDHVRNTHSLINEQPIPIGKSASVLHSQNAYRPICAPVRKPRHSQTAVAERELTDRMRPCGLFTCVKETHSSNKPWLTAVHASGMVTVTRQRHLASAYSSRQMHTCTRRGARRP
jgi:transposase